jgi:Protein of unknown function (DUF3108)
VAVLVPNRWLAAVTLAAASVASAEAPDWLLQGERLTYTLTYLSVVGGTMVLQTVPPAEDGLMRFTLQANSSPFVTKFAVVDDFFETSFDPRLSTFLLSRKETREGKRRGEERIEYDPGLGVARRWKNGIVRDPIKVAPPVLDTLGAVMFLRTLPLAPGRAFQLTVLSGKTAYPLLVAVKERAKVKGAGGVPVETLVVEPRFREGFLAKKEGKLTLWVTTDETHVPVRISSTLPFGTLNASLAKVERPWQAVVESSGGPEKQGKDSHGP